MPRLWLLALLLSVALLVVACNGSSDRSAATAPLQPAATASTPTSPSEPIRSAQTVATNGQRVGYRVCAEWRDWRRLSLEEMAPVFSDKRFAINGRVPPADYAIYLSDFHYVPAPTANSVNRDLVAFTGMALSFGQRPPAVRCDDQELPRVLGTWMELWLAGHRIIDLRRIGGQIVAVVEPAAIVFQEVAFPYPVPLTLEPNQRDINVIQFVDRSGRLLYELRAQSAAWTWQVGDDGQFDFALVVSDQAVVTEPLPLGGVKTRVYAYGNVVPPSTSGAISVIDGSGQEVARKAWSQPLAAWDVLLELDLPPGSYRLRLDGAAYKGVLVLPASMPLPPLA